MIACERPIDPDVFTATHCCEFHALAYQQAMSYMHQWYPPRASMFGKSTFTMLQGTQLERIQQVFAAYYTISLVELAAHQETVNREKPQTPPSTTRTGTNRAKVSRLSDRHR